MARVRQAREQADQWAAEEGRVAHLAATSKGASTDGHDGTEEEETEVAELLSRVLTGPHTTPEPGSTPSGTLREGRAYSAAWSSSGGRRGRRALTLKDARYRRPPVRTERRGGAPQPRQRM